MDQIESLINQFNSLNLNYHQIHAAIKKMDKKIVCSMYKDIDIITDNIVHINSLFHDKITITDKNISVETVINIIIDILCMPKPILEIIFYYTYKTKYITDRFSGIYGINNNNAILFNLDDTCNYGYLTIYDIIKDNIIRQSKHIDLFEIKYDYDNITTIIFVKDDANIFVYIEISKKILIDCYLLLINLKTHHIEKIDYHKDNILEYYCCFDKDKTGEIEHIYYYNDFFYICYERSDSTTIYEIDFKKNKYFGKNIVIDAVDYDKTYLSNLVFINNMLFVTEKYKAGSNEELKKNRLVAYRLDNFGEKEIINLDISLNKLKDNKKRSIKYIKISSSIFYDRSVTSLGQGDIGYNLFVHYNYKYESKYTIKNKKIIKICNYIAIFNINSRKIVKCKKIEDFPCIINMGNTFSYSNVYNIANSDNYVICEKNVFNILIEVADVQY